MDFRSLQLQACLAGVLCLAAWAPAARGACTLAKVADFKATMSQFRPMVEAKINGKDTRFMVDSGAFFSFLSPSAARALDLKLGKPPAGMFVVGVGGRTNVQVAKVDDFVVADATIHDIDFLVGGSEFGEAAGLLGQNVLGAADVEYDLSNGVVRMMRPSDDCRNVRLAFWAGSSPYSVIELDWTPGRRQHTMSTATINGTVIRVMFDTGATSLLSPNAARRAGIKLDGPGVTAAGFGTGIGKGNNRTWIVPVDDFTIGDESISHTHLRVGEIGVPGTDMLIGVDFFLSHHIYVANSREKLYFTYNGGPVFNLATLTTAPVTTEGSAETAETPAAAEAMDADAYSRRGAGFVARHELDKALADLDKACELDPAQAKYRFQRGQLHATRGEMQLARDDLDAALERSPQDPEILLTRARVAIALSDLNAARDDLAATDRLVATDANLRLALGSVYLKLLMPTEAISQFSRWIASHDVDGMLPVALGGRCRARAFAGRDLEGARSDCESALAANPGSPDMLLSRGLLRYKLGMYRESVADLDAVLRREPANAWAMYARGVDYLRLGEGERGRTDTAAAIGVQAGIGEAEARVGIAP